MKFADAPQAVRADLLTARKVYGKPGHRTPADGELWFTDQDDDEDKGSRCSICGYFGLGGPLQNDHCHMTGIWRGYLCRDCNWTEGRKDAPRFDWWALHAPGITGERLLHGPEGLLNGYSRDELKLTPMADLLADSRCRYLSGNLHYMWTEWRIVAGALAIRATQQGELAAGRAS